MDVAKALSVAKPELLDATKFEADLNSEKVRNGFLAGSAGCALQSHRPFSFAIISGPEKAVLITGYRPYEVLLQAIAQVAPALKSAPIPESILCGLESFGGTLTAREKEELAGLKTVGKTSAKLV